jgi:acetyl-CoA carboxylase biotin carboxyl carrier protein
MKKTPRKTAAASSSPAGSKRPASPSSGSTDNLNLAEIKELIELVSDKQFNEFELERGHFRLRLQKGVLRVAAEAAPAAASPVPTAPPVAAAAPPAPAEPEETLHIVTSPIVGTFYRASSPTAEPFAKIGDSVESGKTLCIIEAMKLMNEIQSDASGVVAKIFVENGQPVEYGQPLFGLKL